MVGGMEDQSGWSAQRHCPDKERKVITVVYHHGGTLVTKDDGEMVYEMGEIAEQVYHDVNTLDVFELKDHHKVLGYENIEECWWLAPGRTLKTGLRALCNEDELAEMCFLAQVSGGRVHIYYQHGVSVPEEIDECPRLIEMPPSTKPVHTETPPPIVVDDDSDIELVEQGISPSKTQPVS
ncbi:hypothetical protein PIB30_034007 [Stylosanthes scabra]|uniref:PB1-like domain-containing protein n=1 Tax=Stylosanthes scabra TaxID=79078 RepID=A0ABU6VDF0_9FABA|nr:hypothetical protein [Stylosanthes scabra]